MRTVGWVGAALTFVLAVSGCGGSSALEGVRFTSDPERLPRDLQLPRGVTPVGPVWTWHPGTEDVRQSVFVRVDGNLDRVAHRMALKVHRVVDVPRRWSAFPLPAASCYNEEPGDRRCGFGDSGLRFKRWWSADFTLRDDRHDSLPPSGWILFPGAPTEFIIPAPGERGGPTVVDKDIDGEDPLQIVDGSFVAAEAPVDSVTGGYRLVIAVTGDEDAVFDGYVDQNPLGTREESADEQFGELHFRRFRSSDAGAGGFAVTLNAAGGNAWLLVERWND